jgi:hypothetical protein
MLYAVPVVEAGQTSAAAERLLTYADVCGRMQVVEAGQTSAAAERAGSVGVELRVARVGKRVRAQVMHLKLVYEALSY